MRLPSASLLALALGIAVAAPAAAAPTPLPGLYEGKAKRSSAKLDVTNSDRATVRYSLRGKCGKAKGRIRARPIRDGRFQGRKRIRSAKARSVVVVKGRFIGTDRARLVFTQVVKADARDGGTAVCRARRVKIEAVLGGRAADNGPNPTADAGHWEGSDRSGLPISFDLAFDPTGSGQVTNLDADVATDCTWFGDDEEDPGIATQVIHLRDLSGEVNPNGDFSVYVTPDDDTEFDIFGSLGNAEAELEVAVDGPFDLAGNHDPSSELYCDNWGESYTAARVGP
jgi:hypothetical protein